MNLYGIGIDVVDLTRDEFKTSNFFERYMTPEEYQIVRDNKQITPHYYAGIWSLKEAIIKATNHQFNIQDISIKFTNEAPICNLPGYKLFLSISYEKQIAVAVAICFKE
ncbi:MAG: 4'-phosphopantetheinyl transferase superfamily protein [Ureaplasma sp.]|nr:4'-phosphopantetheinyl transferase superfamily protein [Ureaplasma sp.]MDE7222076.1 4'-phosphopantetheinyl transferase superfamily protein [Ureaplasma sp.]